MFGRIASRESVPPRSSLKAMRFTADNLPLGIMLMFRPAQTFEAKTDTNATEPNKLIALRIPGLITTFKTRLTRVALERRPIKTHVVLRLIYSWGFSCEITITFCLILDELFQNYFFFSFRKATSPITAAAATPIIIMSEVLPIPDGAEGPSLLWLSPV